MTMMVHQEKNDAVQHIDVALRRGVYLAIASLAVANRTTKSELISHLVENSPAIRREMHEMESEPESIFAISGETIEESDSN
jgi:hypothetical protein